MRSSFAPGFTFEIAWGGGSPLSIMIITDLALNQFYYKPRGWGGFQIYQLMNYAAYAALFWLGRRFSGGAPWLKLVGGGILGGILFYLVTNTAAWFFNPFENREYGHDWKSWLVALTAGTSAWPGTWEFFPNTLFSAGLFTALFAAAMKYSQNLESAAEKKAAEATDESENGEPEAEEAKAAS